MKVKVDPQETANWLQAGLGAIAQAMKGANFTLKEMLRRSASRLDVRESSITIAFGKFEKRWCWRAELLDDSKVFCSSGRLCAWADDPMSALGELVDKAEQ